MRHVILVLLLGLLLGGVSGPSAAEGEAKYYLVENGAQAGPFSLDQLKARAAASQIKKQDLVWTQGMADWTRIADVPEVLAVFPQVNVPAPPPPRDLNQFIAGTWAADPQQIPVQGVGVGTATGTITYQAIGGYALKGVISGIGTGGLQFNIDVASTGTFKTQSLGTNSFRIIYEGDLSMTWRGLDPSVPGAPVVTKMQAATYEILDENTLKDGEGYISRRQL